MRACRGGTMLWREEELMSLKPSARTNEKETSLTVNMKTIEVVKEDIQREL